MSYETEPVKLFTELLNLVEKEWGNWHQGIRDCENEIQDLLHEVELTKFNAYQGYELCKKIQEVRHRRRILKDNIDMFRSIKELNDNNKNLKINLYKVIKAMEKVEEYQGQRVYHPRVRTDISLAEKG
ncbi:MAG: hypothetical protein AB7E31_14730 [Desulfitobacterium sp.]